MSSVGELSPTTRHHLEKAVDALVNEFGDAHPRKEIQRLVDDSVAQLVVKAEVEDFLPALAHRFARERLKALTRSRSMDAVPEVLFVGLEDSARGQMAAALVTLRSDGRVIAHSAGSQAGAEVDRTVIDAVTELGADLSEAYAKPLTPEVIAAADVVVTMGRSVGAVEIPSGKRHEDWRVGDPTGAPPDEVRRVRDEIDRRVQELIEELVSTADSWSRDYRRDE